MKIRFTVQGPPKGKQRPRVCRVNGQSVTYTPRQTIEYENWVRASYTAVSRAFFEKNEPLEISILALFSIPQSASKKLKRSMLVGDILPTKKPDCDNIIKIILDGLNGVAYQDDSQVCRVYFEKMYAENPEIKVLIRNIKENEL